MDAEQAWQAALGQLQMEMPKASFDTWVRDTRLISYADGQFTVGVRNSYARDWLESRLSSTVTRLLMGMMNRGVSVEFAVADAENKSAEENDAPADEPVAPQPQDDELEVIADYDLVYDKIVVPDHVTLVSRYFLRHLPLIGPDLAWLYLSFRQAAFNTGGRSGTRRERFSGQTIAARSGMTERTFWNKVGDPATWDQFQGLVSTSAVTPEWDTSSTTPKRLPRRYTVSMTLPLTATDARSLRSWLTANIEHLGGPEKVIEAAATTPIDELLPPTGKAQEGDKPETVAAILRGLYADLLPAERLATLSSSLHKHIMPDRDKIGVTHFFADHLLPYLGPGPAWLVTLIRDLAWSDPDTGEERNTVKVDGGYAEISSWLGVTPETIWRWLNGKHSESRGKKKPIPATPETEEKPKRKRGPGRQASEAKKLSFPVLSIYLRETTSKVLDRNTSPRTFEVLQDEIPAEIIEAALNEQASQAFDQALDDQANASVWEKDGSRAVCSIGMARFVVSQSPITARFAVSDNPILARFAVSDAEKIARFADDSRAVCSIVFARFADDSRAVCRVFKSLIPLNRIPNRDNNRPALSVRESSSAEKPATGQEPGGRDHSLSDPAGETWDLEELFKSMDIHPKTQAKLRGLNVPAWPLVAWLIQAMTMRGVEDPIRFAISRVLNRETRYQVNEDCELLAKNNTALLHEIKRTLARSYSLLSGELGATYKRVLGNDQAAASFLWRTLTGEESCEGVSVTRVKTVTLTERDGV